MWGFPSGSEVKNPPAVQKPPGDVGLIPGSGRSLEGGYGNPLQYSAWGSPCTEERGSLQSTGSHRVKYA